MPKQMKEYKEKQVLVRKLNRLFPDPEVCAKVFSILNEYGKKTHEQEPDRVRLAILKISENTVTSIKQNTQLAKQDFRDILAAAEYPKQSRNWSMPEGPGKQELIRQDRLLYEHWLFKE